MSTKSFIWIGMFTGTTVGGLIPMLWGASFVSMSSVILTAVGGIAGIYLGYRLSQY